MLKVLLLPFVIAAAAGSHVHDAANEQLLRFKNRTKYTVGTLTTDAGACVDYKEATDTLNTNLLQNEHLMDLLTQTVRRNIPERIVHAPGAGAFGYFEVTHDITHICKAKLFSEIGKRTPVAMRFSPGFSSMGVSDTIRESRAFALKFYTEEGNFDLTTLNLPIFAVKDPLYFAALLSTLKRNPVTNLPDNNMVWDFVTLHPEALNQLLRLFSHEGMPDGYRHMRGFGIHTNQVYDKSGRSHFVKFYVLPKGGAKFLNASQAKELASGDPNYYARDLYNAIEDGNYPKWQLSVQIIPECDALNPELGVFDVTREQSIKKYPLHPVGDIILNRNPNNFFTDVEQLAFCPGNVCPGILGCLDKVCESRRMAYRDAQSYRLGSNFKKIPVNAPVVEVHTFGRNGVPPVGKNGGEGPDYFPNTFGGPQPCVDEKRPKMVQIKEYPEPRNLDQVADFYSSLTSVQKSELVDTLVEHLSSCIHSIQQKVIKLFTKIHSSLGKKIAKGLKAHYAS